MNGRIVFLLEEPSMKLLLEDLLPRIFAGWKVREQFLCIAHEGKNDLRKSIPRKLRAWRDARDRFVILQDQDQSDCKVLKQGLIDLCEQAGREDAMVRIVCRELEAWYFGDLAAIANEYKEPSLLHRASRRKFQNPDAIDRPSGALQKLLTDFQKLSGARRMARCLSAESNTSRSFQVFLAGVKRLATQMGYSEPI